MKDTIFVDIDTVPVWHTLTMRVHDWGIDEYMSTYLMMTDMYFVIKRELYVQ